VGTYREDSRDRSVGTIGVCMLWDARTRLAINIENQQLLDQILRTAQTQYSVGQASQQDILKTGVELAKARSDEALIRQEIISAESMLHAFLNRPNNVPIGLVTLDSLIPIQHSLATILLYSSGHHPMLSQDSLILSRVIYGQHGTSGIYSGFQDIC